MAPLALEMLLQQLWESCKMFDLRAVQKIMLTAPIDYRPDDCEIHDMMWQKPSEHMAKPMLRIVPSKL